MHSFGGKGERLEALLFGAAVVAGSSVLEAHGI